MNLEDRIEQIRSDIQMGRFTTAAKESAAIIEFSFREIFRRSIGVVGGAARTRALEAEQKIGGPGKDVDDFTLGELVRLFRESRLFEAYTEAAGTPLRAITMIDFSQVVDLRNRLQHGMHEATRAEAQLFLYCVENMLEAFGILTLEAASEIADADVERSSRKTELAAPRSSGVIRSSYTPKLAGETERLKEQAVLHRTLDQRMIAQALSYLDGPVLALDFGCAWGGVTIDRFSNLKGIDAVLGLDREEACIEHAAEVAPENFRFEVLDLESPDSADRLRGFLSDYADHAVLAFCAMTLHHLAAPIRVAKMWRQVLPAGSRLVVRTFDDGSKFDFPSESGRLQEIIALTQQGPETSDRLHGRKMFHQLYRAGYRDIELFAEPILVPNLSHLERELLFHAHYTHRTAAWEGVDDLSDRQSSQLAEMRELLDEFEFDLQDPSYFLAEFLLGAVAEVVPARS